MIDATQHRCDNCGRSAKILMRLSLRTSEFAGTKDICVVCLALGLDQTEKSMVLVEDWTQAEDSFGATMKWLKEGARDL